MIKLAIIPYCGVIKQMVGEPHPHEIIAFGSRIFAILGRSSEEVKNYYKIPFRFCPKGEETESITTLVDSLLGIGLKIHEVN